MIYNLQNNNNPQETTEFITQLKHKNFSGDIESGYDQRHTVATDNSIYQLLPQLVLYPKNTEDVSKVLKLINQPQFSSFTVTARGGGTGTNGQSLTNGIMLDTSRHMNKILDVNVGSRWALVGCGVIKDQLNDVLKKDNLFFAPELSTSDRATIGGMVNTDASGQGSLVYGKTSDHVLEITYVMSDGSIHTAKTILAKDLPKLAKQQNKTAQIYNLLAKIYRENQQEIQQLYPNIIRKLSGYDLKNLYNTQGDFNLNSVLCGSEGTLVIVCEVKINLEPIPEHMVLVVTYYDNFITALKDAQHLLTFKPTLIEIRFIITK